MKPKAVALSVVESQFPIQPYGNCTLALFVCFKSFRVGDAFILCTATNRIWLRTKWYEQTHVRLRMNIWVVLDQRRPFQQLVILQPCTPSVKCVLFGEGHRLQCDNLVNLRCYSVLFESLLAVCVTWRTRLETCAAGAMTELQLGLPGKRGELSSIIQLILERVRERASLSLPLPLVSSPL